MLLRLLVLLTAMTLGAIFFLVPPAAGLGNLVRIAFFHIPAAWVSVAAFCFSAAKAFTYLRGGDKKADALSAKSIRLGFFFVLFATLSGAYFAKLTWGAWWNWDPRETSIFLLILIYGAYLALRSAIADAEKRARVSAVYALLSFLSVPFLVFILPRLTFSLHPEPLLNAQTQLHFDPLMGAVLFLALCNATFLYYYLLHRGTANKKEDVV